MKNTFLAAAGIIMLCPLGVSAAGGAAGALGNFMWVFPLGALILLLAGCKLAPKGEWQKEPLGLRQAKCVQGICAVLIILHHSSQEFVNNGTGNPGALILFQDAGVLFVAVFFFFSGYGLLRSLQTKPNYLKGFLCKRVLAVYIPFFVCVVIFDIAFAAVGMRLTPLDYLLTLVGVIIMNPHTWFMVEIILLYLLFWGIFRFIRSRKAAWIVMTAILAAFTFAGPLFGHGGHWFQGEWWYNTTLLFAFGMLAAQYEEKLTAFLHKRFIPLAVCLAAAFFLLYHFTSQALADWSYWAGLPQAYGCLTIQLPMVICFIALLITILQKVHFENRVLRFLGGIGLEIYLMHYLFLMGFHDPALYVIRNEFLYVSAIIACTIAVAVPIHWLNQKLVSIASGRKMHVEN